MDPTTRADLARAVITNPTFEDAFKMLEQSYKDNMADTAPEQVEERNRWHICLLTLKDVKTALTAVIQNGTIEAENAKGRERVKNVGTSARSRDKRTNGRTSET